MSHELINHSPDLKRLRDEGYAIQVKEGHLLLYDVPYVTFRCEVSKGILAAPLTITRGIATKPANHVIYFVGENPCNADGSIITAIQHGQGNVKIGNSIIANRSFSNKPQGGYDDNYHKFTTYAAIISHPAMEIDPGGTLRTYRLIEEEPEDSIFSYMDTNSSRNGTMFLADKFRNHRVGIIGLGGTGAYILDAVAKTPVGSIHLFDDDIFSPHNAFRTPGAASLEDVNAGTYKVHYLAQLYSAMHRGIVPHQIRIVKSTLSKLSELDFVFIAIDSGEHKRAIFGYLIDLDIPFIDVGIGVAWDEERQQLRGSVRTTFGSSGCHDHLSEVVSFASDEENLYDDNIQIAELNGINANIAVIKWKQHLEIYQKTDYANNTVLTINDTVTYNEF